MMWSQVTRKSVNTHACVRACLLMLPYARCHMFYAVIKTLLFILLSSHLFEERRANLRMNGPLEHGPVLTVSTPVLSLTGRHWKQAGFPKAICIGGNES